MVHAALTTRDPAAALAEVVRLVRDRPAAVGSLRVVAVDGQQLKGLHVQGCRQQGDKSGLGLLQAAFPLTHPATARGAELDCQLCLGSASEGAEPRYPQTAQPRSRHAPTPRTPPLLPG